MNPGLGNIPLDTQLVCQDASIISRTPLQCSVGVCEVPSSVESNLKVRLLPFPVAHTALVMAVRKNSAAHRCLNSLRGEGPPAQANVGGQGEELGLPGITLAELRWLYTSLTDSELQASGGLPPHGAAAAGLTPAGAKRWSAFRNTTKTQPGGGASSTTGGACNDVAVHLAGMSQGSDAHRLFASTVLQGGRASH